MSHFSVMVIGDEPEAQMAPYHEFECTGLDDEFVQNIDRTEEIVKDFEESTCGMFKDPNGVLYRPYEDRFYREPTSEEAAIIGTMAGCGGNGTISWDSKDWGDGRGYRSKVHFCPEGWEEVEIPISKQSTLVEYAESNYGCPPIVEGAIFGEDHKYGYTLIGGDGQVIKIIDRTNPNSKWDYYRLGGRWRGFFKIKTSATGSTHKVGEDGWDSRDQRIGWADQVRKADIDFEGMMDEAGQKAGKNYDKVLRYSGPLEGTRTISEIVDDPQHKDLSAGAKRAIYRAQPAVERLEKAYQDTNDRDLAWVQPGDYRCTREEYVAAARSRACTTFAVVVNGEWHEKGKMGWWGTVSKGKIQEEWNRQVATLLEGLDPDTLLTVYDCHV